MTIRIVSAGDAAIVAEMEERIDPIVNRRAVALADALRAGHVPGVRDIVPTFRSVAVYFDPLVTDVEQLAGRIHELATRPLPDAASESTVIDVPVCYDPEFAPDLGDVAAFGGVRPSDVVDLHTRPTYRVYMLGFVPGFAYLGTVDERIAAPRRSEPRLAVPAGSVAIAGHQTGIYPRRTPGGWNIIGRTPLRLVSLDRTPPTLLRPGDAVRFRPIAREAFDQLSAQEPAA